MTSDQITTGPVELGYTLTPDDLVDGFTARRRRLSRRWPVTMALAPPVGLAIASVVAQVWTLPADKARTLAVAYLVLLLVAEAFVLPLYWLYARLCHPLLLRSIYRWQARLILRGNPWMAQPIRATVTDTGVRAGNATGEGTSYWSQYPLYDETDQSFVLLASKGLGASMFVLPKRGMGGEDAARLRALLDAHCSRRH